MSNENLLPILKLNLQLTSNAYDELLKFQLNTAVNLITREGITLTDSSEDAMLVVMYAAYLYQKRNSNEPMPRMLRYALNNRVMSEKGGADA